MAWPGPSGSGYINLHWQAPEGRGAGFRGRPFKDINDFMDLAQRAAVKPGTFKEIYFCMSTQRVTGKLVHGTPVAHRHATQATAVKALWIDVDVKPEKGYPDLDQAMDAINKFVGDANLPPYSAIVYSGGGVHVYWISDKALTPAEWEPFAQGLRAEIQLHGLKCDAGLTTDIARVLRVPGTFNNKTTPPRPVVCKWLGDSYDFPNTPGIARLATIVPVKVTSQATATVTQARGAPFDLSAFPAGRMNPLFLGELDPVNDAISGLSLRSDAPLDITEVVKGCTHFQDCKVNHGKMHGQGLWALTLLATTFFENGRQLAYDFSDGYPTYDRGETDKKFDEKLTYKERDNLGWPSCKAFEGEGAKCKSCPFYNKLRSPLNLAERVAAPIIYTQQAPPPPDDLMLPVGYCTNDRGWICEIVTKTMSNGSQSDAQEPLFMCELRNPIAQAGRRTLLFETSLDMGKWGPASMPEVLLATEQGCMKQLRDCGVKPFPRYQKGIIQFMTSWMEKLDTARSRIQTVPFGWLRQGDDGTGKYIGFAYGGQVYLADGTEQKAGYTDQQLEGFYKPRGEIQPWYDALHIVTAQKHAPLEAIIAIGFASPLMVFTGLYNCVAHAWSMESGAHKSTSIALGASIWGSPKMTKESPMSSNKGIVHKLGELKNLPIFWDEINSDEKLDQVRTILEVATNGGGGTLLTQGRDFHKKDEWQTLILVGANKSLSENIMRSVRDTDAQLQRVFEFYVEPKEDTQRQSDVSILINSLDYNFGRVGQQYAAYLGRHAEEIEAYVGKVLRRFENAVAHASKERYRAAMAVTIFCGAEIANKVLGCDFNLPELWEFLTQQYMRQRQYIQDAEIVGGTATNSVNAFTQFVKSHTRNCLWITTMPPMKSGKPDPITYIAGPNVNHPDPVHIRLAVNDRMIEVSKERMMTFLKNVDQNGAAVLSGLKKHFHAKELPRVNLSAGAGVGGGREPIIRIPVPAGSPFIDLLYKHTPVDERPEDAKMAVSEWEEVTAAVTATEAYEEAPRSMFVKGDGPDKPVAKDTGIMGAATAQAAKDLATVRRASS